LFLLKVASHFTNLENTARSAYQVNILHVAGIKKIDPSTSADLAMICQLIFSKVDS